MYYILIALALTFLAAGATFFIKSDNIPSPIADTNQDTEVPEPVQKNQSKTLDLSGQNLTQVPGSVLGRTDIEVLDLSHNNLDGALPAEIRNMRNLRTLDLSDNNFTGVPAEVGQLTNLEVLDLSNNPITGLPHEIGNLKNLRVLDLRGTDYATADLEVIKKGLSKEVEIKTD